jgi:hypothetical protein
VQLLVLGFNDPDFQGGIAGQLERLRESGTVRVIDSLAVFKDAAGEIEVQQLGPGVGRLVGALVGLRVEGEEELELSAAGGAGHLDDEGWDVLQDIPSDTAAALVLLEHQWAVPLREAIVGAGGFRISDGFISPLDLVEIGLVTPAEAEALHAIETGAR